MNELPLDCEGEARSSYRFRWLMVLQPGCLGGAKLLLLAMIAGASSDCYPKTSLAKQDFTRGVADRVWALQLRWRRQMCYLLLAFKCFMLGSCSWFSVMKQGASFQDRGGCLEFIGLFPFWKERRLRGLRFSVVQPDWRVLIYFICIFVSKYPTKSRKSETGVVFSVLLVWVSSAYWFPHCPATTKAPVQHFLDGVTPCNTPM